MKILQILDESHRQWVQGGVFSDLRNALPQAFDTEPVYIKPMPRGLSIFRWILTSYSIESSSPILFSSLTPAENYLGVRFFTNATRELGLWYTHKDGALTKREKRVLRRMDVIFVHSDQVKMELSKITPARVITILGALDPQRFSRASNFGDCIAWIGTPVQRKRPDLLISLIKLYPNLNFRILGKNWKVSPFWDSIKNAKNVTYVELVRPITSADLDGCDIYLMTSRIEGGPMPLLETIASGLTPIIVNQTGFVEDVLNYAGLPKNYTGTKPTMIAEEINQSRINRSSDECWVGARAAILELSFTRQANIIIDTYQSHDKLVWGR